MSLPLPIALPSLDLVAEKAYSLKGFVFTMLTMSLKLTDPTILQRQIHKEKAETPELLGEPLVLDLHEVANERFDLPALAEVLRGCGLVLAGVCNASPQQQRLAQAAGLPVLIASAAQARKRSEAAANPREAEPAKQTAPSSAAQATHIHKAQVRTGQRVFSQGDITVLAAINPGAEVLAAGSIHVYGPLRGRALAGVGGDTNARIFTSCMQAELVSIAGCFRVLDKDLGPDIQGKPAQIYLDGERVVIEAL